MTKLANISEVSKILNLVNPITKKPLNHILRYWEKEFAQIRPKKINNQRYYNHKQIELIKMYINIDNQNDIEEEEEEADLEDEVSFEPNYVDENAGIQGSNNISFLADEGLAEYVNQESLPDENITSGEVFHLRDNIYNYDDAKAACNAYDSRLATLKEVINSYKDGGNWCNYGWSQGQLALYPTQTKFWKKLQEKSSTKNNCGTPGVNGGYFHNPYFEIGANCYGKRPVTNNVAETKLDNDLDLKTKNFKDLRDANKLKVSPLADFSPFTSSELN